MSISLQQVSQIGGIIAFSGFTNNGLGRSIVLNPTLPAIVFDFAPGAFVDSGAKYVMSVDISIAEVIANGVVVGIIIGSQVQQILYPQSNLLTILTPPLWFYNVIIFGGGVCGQYGCLLNAFSSCGPWLGEYNPSNNNFNYTCMPFPSNNIITNLFDIIIDFENQNIYFIHSSSVDAGLGIFAIPFSELQNLVTNLYISSNWLFAWIEPSNAPSPFYIYPGNGVLYNDVFFFSGADEYDDPWFYVVAYDEIPWAQSFPSTPTPIGTAYQLGSAKYSEMPQLFLNYIYSNGNITPEILVYVPEFFANAGYYADLNIYSIDPNTLNYYQLTGWVNANCTARAIYFDGTLVFPNYIEATESGITFSVSAYVRSSNSFITSQPIQNLLDVKVSEPGYVVTFSGSSSNMTVTIYQVLFQKTPAIVSLVYADGVLQGTVTSLNDNTPLPNAVVILFSLASQNAYSNAGTIVDSTTTDDNGNFQFQLKQAGYYGVQLVSW